MALLNAAISGAILLAMASVALNVSEGMIAAQYERDLQQNASAMVGAVQGAKANMSIQFASGYSVFVSSGKEAQLISTTGVHDETLVAAITKTQDVLAEKLGRMKSTDSVRQDDALMTQRFFVTTDAAGARNSGVLFFEQRMIYGFPNLLIEAHPKAYRVSASVAVGEPEQQVLVLQDRTDELAAVAGLRWLFGACVLGGLVLTGFASLYLSTRSIRPVEQSLKQQRAFVAAASHELRTPVAAVRANAEVLVDAPLGDFTPHLRAITQESIRMSHLVSDLMDLARADTGELQVRDETVDAAEIMRRAATLLEPLANQKNHTLEIFGESVFCRADSERLCQVLVILLDNAIRYTQEGGWIRLSAAREGAQVCIKVEDDGPGILNEYKEKVFERFVRLDASRPSDGSGLGLSIADQLTRQMHGTLTLTDTPEGGCSFRMHLRTAK